MKLAAPDAFDHAMEVVVFDDHVRDGSVTAEGTLLGFRLFSREHFALLLVSTVTGLYALRIDPDGMVKLWPTVAAKD